MMMGTAMKRSATRTFSPFFLELIRFFFVEIFQFDIFGYLTRLHIHFTFDDMLSITNTMTDLNLKMFK